MFARPNGLRENADIAISFRGPVRTCQTEEVGIPVVERRRKAHRCAFVAKQQRVEPTEWENVKYTGRNGMY